MSGAMQLAFLIVTVALLASVAKTWIAHQHKQPEVDEDLRETLDKIDLLEERIRVLERIVTENRYDLKKEIDSL